MSEPVVGAAKAELLEDEGRIPEAIDLWRSLLQADPRPELEHRLGSALLTNGQFVEAEGHLKTAMAGAPQMAEPRLGLGWLYYVTKRFAEARSVLREGLHLKEWAPGYNILGAVYRSLGDAEEALKAFEKAVSLDPEDSEALYGLGVELRRCEPARAEELFRRSLSVDPESASAHRELGFVLWKRGRLEEAEREVRRSLELDYSNPWAHVYLGNLLLIRGALDEAEAALKTATLIWPASTVARGHLGEVKFYQGHLAEAEGLLRSVLDVAPQDYKANLRLGEVLAAQGRVEEARSCLQRAVEVQPSRTQARKALEELDRQG